MAAPSLYERSTVVWEEEGSVATDGEYEDDDRAYFKYLDQNGGDMIEEEADEFDIEEMVEDCGPVFDAVTGRPRSSDDDLRMYAIMQPISDMWGVECAQGNRGRCLHGGHCCQSLDLREIRELRSKFWDFERVKAPSTSERNAKITEMLKYFVDAKDCRFNYFVQKSDGSKVPVCEGSFMRLLGYKSNHSTQWHRCKTKVMGIVMNSLQTEEIKKHRRPRAKHRFESAKTWIRQYAKSRSNLLVQQAASLQRQGELIEGGSADVTIKSIPFETERQFYHFYKGEMAAHEEIAGLTCFISAFKSFSNVSMKEEGIVVRLKRCKHNFSTCDICNNGWALFHDQSRHWGVHQKQVLWDYIQTHLNIQDAEREEQRRAINAARQFDAIGQPKEAFMLFDGFSVYKGVSPKWSRGSYGGKSHTEKEEPKVENRIIAGIVVCGDIDTVFVYSVDQLTSGGANLMIEVIRQALSDLGELLKGSKKLLPKVLYLQFDNCGENKNKFMMAYCSMLVESDR